MLEAIKCFPLGKRGWEKERYFSKLSFVEIFDYLYSAITLKKLKLKKKESVTQALSIKRIVNTLNCAYELRKTFSVYIFILTQKRKYTVE